MFNFFRNLFKKDPGCELCGKHHHSVAAVMLCRDWEKIINSKKKFPEYDSDKKLPSDCD